MGLFIQQINKKDFVPMNVLHATAGHSFCVELNYESIKIVFLILTIINNNITNSS